ncbi:MAG: hypothetical protein KA207_09305 [Burkholderiaceae bacterium]|nr:hypothetical protein [Burkholderiaceae bacterium]
MQKLIRSHNALLQGSPIRTLLPQPAAAGDVIFVMDLDEPARKVWLDCLLKALDEVQLPLATCEEIWSSLETLSVHMLKTDGNLRQPPRYSYQWMLSRARHPALGMCRR